VIREERGERREGRAARRDKGRGTSEERGERREQ